MKVYTIGHSTREVEELITILKAYDVTQLIDVRTMPMSRYTPQFNHDALAESLRPHGISYQHLKRLGGLRPAKKIPLMAAGATRAFGAMPTTCRPMNLPPAWMS